MNKPWQHGHPLDRQQIHDFWRNPDPTNLPHLYLDGAIRSNFLVDIVKRHVSPDNEILEIGCNVGRNLNWLLRAGFSRLTGVEINGTAVKLLRESFPRLDSAACIINEPIETAIKQFPDGAFQCVYTMAVLEHIHSESEWIFADMARIAANVLITIEDERNTTWRHWPRDYGRVFGALGLHEVETLDCSVVDRFGPDFVARVFTKTLACSE